MNDNILVLNNALHHRIISRDHFSELKHAMRCTEPLTHESRMKIIQWFIHLHEIEISGWRNKQTTRNIAAVLKNSRHQKIQFYALFCPSYKKGNDAFGVRTDGVGVTTLAGIKNLIEITQKTQSLGFECKKPMVIYYDLALEQAEKITNEEGLDSIEKNYLNVKKEAGERIDTIRMSALAPELFQKIGYAGIVHDPLPIPSNTFNRIVERGKKFYELFGWDEKKVIERSKIIATAESLTGDFLRKKYHGGIMVYTPTMLERAAIYSGYEYDNNPLPIIFPKRGP